jgi:hypothetical protein
MCVTRAAWTATDLPGPTASATVTTVAYVCGIPVGVFLVLLVYGGLSGRVRLTSCCAIADPSTDLRMRGAFEDLESDPRSSLGSSAGRTAAGGPTPGPPGAS